MIKYRLTKEYLGEFGPFWQKDAVKKLEKYKDNLLTGEMFIDGENVLRWLRSGNIVPSEIVELLYTTSNIKEIVVNATKIARNNELGELREFMKNKSLSKEEEFELKANFKKGTVVVNVITGERYTV